MATNLRQYTLILLVPFSLGLGFTQNPPQTYHKNQVEMRHSYYWDVKIGMATNVNDKDNTGDKCRRDQSNTKLD